MAVPVTPVAALVPGVTVIGNLAVDYIDDDPPSPGGCPSFAGVALAPLGAAGRIVTRAAAADMPVFEPMLSDLPVACDVLPAEFTSAFGLRYDGDSRRMTVEGVGPSWSSADIAAAGLRTTWVHVSPLLRTDFPSETLQALKDSGHRLSYDGQGLVRVARLGPMVVDGAGDLGLLTHVDVLKIAEDEADVIVGRAFDAEAARRTGVGEVLVTHGSGGCDLYVDGEVLHVPAAWQVFGVHSTGAGDMFTVSYVASRSAGHSPSDAARAASLFVAQRLQERHDALPR